MVELEFCCFRPTLLSTLRLNSSDRCLRFDFLFFDWEVESELIGVILTLLLLHLHLHFLVLLYNIIHFRHDVFGEHESFWTTLRRFLPLRLGIYVLRLQHCRLGHIIWRLWKVLVDAAGLILNVSHLAARRQRWRLRILLDHMLLKLQRFRTYCCSVIPSLCFVILRLDNAISDLAWLLLRFADGDFLHGARLLCFECVSLRKLVLFPATDQWRGRWRGRVDGLVLEPERTVASGVLRCVFQLVALIV